MNNRVLKFRIWSKLSKKIFPTDCITIDKSNTDWEIMQFTGLKDKNQKEIFEGDIVNFQEPDRVSERGEFEDSDGYKYNNIIIKWNDSKLAFCFYISKYRQNESIKYKWIEVIGNIFENPELL